MVAGEGIAFRFHAFAVIRYAQGYLVDVPTWIAAHHAAQQKRLRATRPWPSPMMR